MKEIYYNLAPVDVPLSDYTAIIPLSEVKDHLRVTWSTEDTFINQQLAAAFGICEDYCNLSFVYKQYTMNMEQFPDSETEDSTSFELPRGNGRLSVISIKYYDTDDTQQTWALANYVANAAFQTWSRVSLADGISWPAISGRKQPIEVIYKSGYNDSGQQLPKTIRQAILLMVGNLYENRQDVIVGRIASELPLTAKHLLNPYRRVKV